MAALITSFTIQAVYPKFAKMNEKVKTLLSWLPFLWEKNEVESPHKEKNLIDFGDADLIDFGDLQEVNHRPPPPSVIPPTSPGSFPNMMARLEQLENRIEACKMETREFQAQLNEIQVETNKNQTGPANPTKVEMDVNRKEWSNPIMPCTMPHHGNENFSPPFLPPPSSAPENPFTPKRYNYGYGGL
jgi:hypothetical protein